MDKYQIKLMSKAYRGAERKVGAYANNGYRQLFVKKLYDCISNR